MLKSKLVSVFFVYVIPTYIVRILIDLVSDLVAHTTDIYLQQSYAEMQTYT